MDKKELNRNSETAKTSEKSSTKPKKWTKDHEKILIDWADKAMCYKWLHAKSHEKFSKMNTYFTIPVIVMSTITGTANFAADRVPLEYRGYYSMAIGGVNIMAGIVTTIQQFLKISEINESHRVSSISWDKFYRKIRVELAKPPTERQNVYDFLKSCTEEFDRLMEISPNINHKIIELFKDTFGNENLDEHKRKMFEALKKPEICDSLESVQFSIYKEEPKPATSMADRFINAVNDVISNKHDVEKVRKDNIIKEFITNFEKERIRLPTKREILNNLENEETEIDEEYIDLFMTENYELFISKSNSPKGQSENDIELENMMDGF